MEYDNLFEISNNDSVNGNMRKRLNAVLEKIEDGIMDYLGCSQLY